MNDKIRTPKGKLLTKRQYIAMVSNIRNPACCEHGHFDDALWEGGPCMDELEQQINAGEEGRP